MEGLFLALRALDNHVLVYSVRPVKEGQGPVQLGSKSWVGQVEENGLLCGKRLKNNSWGISFCAIFSCLCSLTQSRAARPAVEERLGGSSCLLAGRVGATCTY